MAAPSGTTWSGEYTGTGTSGSVVYKIGLYTSLSNTDTTTTVTVQIWFYTKYAISDSSNTLYYDIGKTVTSATTSKGSVSLSSSNGGEYKLKEYTHTINRDTSAQTYKIYTSLEGVVGHTTAMKVNKSITIPATYSLTVNYYSNYATSGTYEGETLAVGSDKNIKVATAKYYKTKAYSNGLLNYNNSNVLYLSRTGHTRTGKWGTTTSGGTLISQDTSYTTGADLAKALGKDISAANASINVYAQWTPKTIVVTFYRNTSTSDATTATQTFTYDVSGQTFSNKGWTNSGYTLLGWAHNQDAVSQQYNNLFNVSNNWINKYSPSVNLYAVWLKNEELRTLKININTSGTWRSNCIVWMKVGEKWKQGVLWRNINGEWKISLT